MTADQELPPDVPPSDLADVPAYLADVPSAVTHGAIRIPDWLRRPEERELTRGERFRLSLSNHGALVAGVLVMVLVIGGAGWLGVTVWQRLGSSSGQGPLDYPESGGPYAGTLADAYPVGDEGIVLPAAKASGPFTAAQVTDGLADVREALIALRLDRKTIVNHDVDNFLRLLAPDGRAGLEAEHEPGAAPHYAPLIAKGWSLATEEPRVRGSITYRAVTVDDGIRVLEVKAKFVWVYAFKHRSAYADGDLVTVADETTWHIPHLADVATSSAGLHLADDDFVVWNVDCATFRDNYLSPLSDAKALAEPEAPDAGDPFDPEQSLESSEGC